MEVWKDIKGYEGLYQVSNLGNVNSLNGKRWNGRTLHKFNGKELKRWLGSNGYFTVSLSKDGIKKNKQVHQLVAIGFLGHKPNGFKLVVNHINFNKLDNRVENLEIVTQRENANQKHLPSSSKYVGVCWNKRDSKWQSAIRINGKIKHLGLFANELEASNAYQSALDLIS